MRKRNRKGIAIGLAMMMVLGMLGNTGITARAEDAGQETEAVEVQSASSEIVEEPEAIAQQNESSDTIAVNISWGSLAFTYRSGQWNPETCTYMGGGWEAEAGDGAFVSVTNSGTAAVNVEYQFTAAEQTVVKNLQGTFVDEDKQLITTLSVSAGGTTKKAELHLESDRPTECFESTTIGTITIVIKE